SCTLLVLAASIHCLPTAGKAVPNTPENEERLAHLGPDDLAEELSGQFEGDMVLEEDQIDMVRSTRNGLIAPNRRWPNRIVYYYIHEQDFTQAQVDHIELGVRLLQSQSCLKFQRVTSDAPAYIRVIGSDSGCYSSVGFTGRAQNLNLAPNNVGQGCFRIGTVVHEFLHALGFYHQQSASDRDEFVDIIWENIEQGKENNFNIYNSNTVTDFNVRYDYGSVMHYGPTAFSINGQRTIVPKDPNATIGQRLGMSERDISKLNWMYALHPLGIVSSANQPADQMGDNFEGDILLSEEQLTQMRKRTGMYLPTFLWPDRTVPYEIVSSDFTSEQTNAIITAMRTIEQHTCLRFVPATAANPDYIRISAGSGCSSFVGRIRGPQALRLLPSAVGTGCFAHGTIVHELIHALGFYHMQSATERDNYVDILWQNIVPGREGNFQSYGTDRILNYGVAYDYGSLMHYNTHAFSANGLPTIVPRVANVAIGQREAMSAGDIQRIWNMYQC
uniref:Metalloendopeptidase n=1 Tax=Anopheles epiroticus TaxID=199890 RepID=A0A182P9T8_9DIPT